MLLPRFVPFRLQSLVRVGAVSVCAGAIVAVTTLDYGYFLPLGLLGVGYIAWSFPRPLVAMTTIVLLYAYLYEQSEGISLLEVGFALYAYGYVAYWFVRKIFVDRQRIFLHEADLLLVAFLVLSVISILLLLVRNVTVDWWLREMIAIAGLVFYFPARDVLRTDRAVGKVFSAFLIVAVGISAYNLVVYRTSTIAASYLWELWGGRQTFGVTFFFAAAVLSTSFYLHSRGWMRKTTFLLAFVLSGLALAFTFSRGFWIGAMLGVVVIFFLVERARRLELLTTVSIASILGVLAIVLFAGNIGEYVLRALAVRLSTSGSFVQDISLSNRIVESEAALAMIKQNPVIGFGYGATFPHYNLITKVTEYSIYVHNAYVHMLLKVGILGTAIFFGFVGLVLVRGVRRARANLDGRVTTAMVRGSVGVIVGILFIATNSGILTDKVAILMIALGSAVIMSNPALPAVRNGMSSPERSGRTNGGTKQV